MRAYLPESGTELGNNITLATGVLARMKGLLGKDRLDTGTGLLIRPCKGIHTFFMKFSIDAVFLDQDNSIVALYHSLRPNRITPICLQAASVLELPAGTLCEDVAIGDTVKFF